MQAEILAIGDEVLAGMVVNSNASFISQKLSQIGWDISRHTTLPDDLNAIYEGLKEALGRSTVVLVTGGLGSTHDDVTRNAAAKLFNSGFHYDSEVAADLTKRFGDKLPSLKDQATVPSKAKIVLNAVGTAPGFIFTSEEKKLILMPGIPYEMKPMLENQVIPYLKEAFPLEEKYAEHFHFCLLNESTVDPMLRELSVVYPKVKIGIYPAYGGVTVSMTAPSKDLINPLKDRLLSRFSTYLYPSASGKIEEAVHDLMRERKKTLAFAESCTGGMIAEKITSLSGASDYFLGSIVAYSNSLKNHLLSVSENTLKQYGAVSAETAAEMLSGLFKATKADYGIAVTGIAGPTGGTPEKPVGTVWAAIGERDRAPDIALLKGKGSRQMIIQSTSNRLLGGLWRKIVHHERFVP